MRDAVRSLLCRCAPALALLVVWTAARWEAEPVAPFRESFYVAPDGEVVKLFSTMARTARATTTNGGEDSAEMVAIDGREPAG
jgi:hypothetical protein